MRMPLSSARPWFFHSALYGLLAALDVVQAQSFTWNFTEDIGASLPECAKLPISVLTSSTTSGRGYYMIALAINGAPTTSFVGTDAGSLSWVVNQPAGTSALLYLVDSEGNSGRIPDTAYTVTGGQSSECLPSSTTSTFTVTANATDEIATCDSWQLIMRGGTPPFNILFAAPGSSSVTNVTLPAGDDMYTYVNRASPKGTLLGAVSDSKGMWAKGTPYVRTTGAIDTTCPGRSGSSGVAPPASTSTTSNPTSGPHTLPPSQGSSKTPVIAGVCVAVGCILILAVALFLFLRRRKRNANMEMDYLEPRKFQGTGSEILAMRSTSGPSSTSLFTKQATLGSSVGLHGPATVTSVPSSYEPPSTRSAPASSSTTASITPPALGSRKTKAREANFTTVGPLSATTHMTTPTTAPFPSSLSEDSRWPPGIAPTSPEPGEVVFQHTDARAMTLRELPPPYGSQVSGPALEAQESSQ
ncbi:hypothetical protein FPV67DRAFT_1507116 [Lyophyllum atratum]|nr:hypothetical protein FPV67DRAFT_1507116 [Lyophyllum atratum]